MPEANWTAETMAPMIRAALEDADLDAIKALLDPGVRWGAPGDPTPSCRNREQVLVWYRRAREAGARASVTETAVYGDKILVGVKVTGRPGDQTEVLRWQTLTVGHRGIIDIAGFDDRDIAAATANQPGLTARAQHWDVAYAQGGATRSWFQERPAFSLDMFEKSAVTAKDSVIDIGGGAAPLADELLASGFEDLTVLDISKVGLGHAQTRLGANAARVTWLVADILEWEPQRSYRVWHDRAVFHFLTIEADRHRYLHTLQRATTPGSVAIFGCFATDGPQYCSGLPVARYEPADLAELLGSRWQLITHTHEKHTTPAGATQSFSWIALRRTA